MICSSTNCLVEYCCNDICTSIGCISTVCTKNCRSMECRWIQSNYNKSTWKLSITKLSQIMIISIGWICDGNKIVLKEWSSLWWVISLWQFSVIIGSFSPLILLLFIAILIDYHVSNVAMKKDHWWNHWLFLSQTTVWSA